MIVSARHKGINCLIFSKLQSISILTIRGQRHSYCSFSTLGEQSFKQKWTFILVSIYANMYVYWLLVF